ncbi:uncharacterized protein B0H18DRAFT_1046048 [Fomitopsis serialis]|uniref:uncharacterized protein n=1 Tax=Fomitopsis serialis TaxID=139415 RepID=UPI002008BCE2|nr:uncharacterized protein B0H18DRAFT_1046048 [Neoantrodia serialis]KAH9914292.1 hypothetical protein B0H18DRAFT_1046048 [Neoantrodia serialis]
MVVDHALCPCAHPLALSPACSRTHPSSCSPTHPLQVYMDITCTPEEIEKGISAHVEHAPTNFLSILTNPR